MGGTTGMAKQGKCERRVWLHGFVITLALAACGHEDEQDAEVEDGVGDVPSETSGEDGEVVGDAFEVAEVDTSDVTPDVTETSDDANDDASEVAPDTTTTETDTSNALSNGNACREDGECQSGHCGGGFCCAAGDCCATIADCPADYAERPDCDSQATCQGHRVDVQCVDAQCRSSEPLDDDSACSAGSVAKACNPYKPVTCTGALVQEPPVCPTACTGSEECVPLAHCEGFACVPDGQFAQACVPPEGRCINGLTCIDGLCCGSACSGICERCDTTGRAGTCEALPSGIDPDGDCGPQRCDGYFWGFQDNECHLNADVPNALTLCDGNRGCADATARCPEQGMGEAVFACHPLCQAPMPDTCTGAIPGDCVDIAGPDQQCGDGACKVTVPACADGALAECIPGEPSPEICDGIDNDCNGETDDVAPEDSPLNSNQLGVCAGSHQKCIFDAGEQFFDDYSGVDAYDPNEGEPDELYLDENCDGVDGRLSAAILVAKTGVDSETCGTPITPCLTLTHALARAVAAGRSQILVQRGTYAERVELKSDLGIFGGYDANWLRAHYTTNRVIIQAPDVPGTAYAWTLKITGSNNVLADVDVRAPTITGQTATGDGRSTAAIWMVGATTELIDVEATQSNATAGATGAHAIAAPVNGVPGGSGTDEFVIASCNHVYGLAGLGGEGACGDSEEDITQSGDGGAGGSADTDCGALLAYAPRAGLAGTDAEYVAGSNGTGGAAGNPGVDGGPGVNGTNGQGGVGAPAALARGTLSPDGSWSGAPGTPGTRGEHGTGGGGGGGGAGSNVGTGLLGGGTRGAGGGGGGVGGCRAATVGVEGRAGGASFGVLASYSFPSLVRVSVKLGRGGNGGNGGNGGAGQPGGLGGLGGRNAANVKRAGDGGLGGNGGHSGAGGGGAGGACYGVLGVGSSFGARSVTYSGTCQPGSGGAGGVGTTPVQSGTIGTSGEASQFLDCSALPACE